MSPASERKFMKLLWEKDKMFDSILALTVPCKLYVCIVTRHHLTVFDGRLVAAI